jgi:hypothetical protein
MGSSVEPGLPNIVVIPRARSRSKLASLTVGIGAPYLPAGGAGEVSRPFKRLERVPIRGE